MQSLYDSFVLNFVKDDRWRYLTNGLTVTLKLTFFAVLLGLVIGFVIAMVRSTYENTGKLKILNALCGLYLTVIRGTPVVVQLMIIYFVIFGSVRIDKSFVAILRSGIQSIPKGQFEAGRSLGFTYGQTMTNIIMPQAFRNVIPTLANEFIVLLKETSVAGYIALEDLTKGGDIIRSRTYSAFMPLMAVAIIYLVLVMVFSRGVKYLERRLRQNEHTRSTGK